MVSNEGLLPGMPIAILLYPHMAESRERENKFSPVPFLYEH
jgi:hypothetical protein